jgi:hypothetical protein
MNVEVYIPQSQPIHGTYYVYIESYGLFYLSNGLHQSNVSVHDWRQILDMYHYVLAFKLDMTGDIKDIEMTLSTLLMT